MRKSLSKIALLLTVLFIVSSCAPVMKKRKRCRGNGSWYGNRNLGFVAPKDSPAKTYNLKDSDFTSSIN